MDDGELNLPVCALKGVRIVRDGELKTIRTREKRME